MPRKLSSIAPDWWDYTTLDDAIIRDAAALTPEKMLKLSRPGFKVVFYDTLEEFYLAEALEYITAWKQSTPDNPVGICGPIGPTEQLPLVARLVNDLNLNVSSAPFLGHGRMVSRRQGSAAHASALVREGRPRAVLQPHPQRPGDAECEPAFPEGRHRRLSQDLERRRPLRRHARRAGRREALGLQRPAAPRWQVQEQPALAGGISQADHARGGPASPDHRAKRAHVRRREHLARAHQAISVGPVETWQAEKVSIWHAGNHDNPFGQRLTCLMIAKKLPDAAVPMSLLAGHPNVQFNYYRKGIGTCDVEMH